ncbi:MAG TPA: hypothetical protein VHG89_04920 [Verrucomicrobiae bacterium]|nr:hypothetical protein [Verrucomicrobiae bacterium]
MRKTKQHHLFTIPLATVCAALAAFATNTVNGQSFQDLTNGLVDYYPLTSVLPNGNTPDFISRRDLTLSAAMNSANFIPGSHPGMGDSANVVNLSQSGGATVMYYQSTGQNPLDGSGDFLPFVNQRGATMNFWVKGSVSGIGGELREFAECADNGDNNPFFSISSTSSSDTFAHFFLRLNASTTDTNGTSVNQLSDGTYQTPAYYYVFQQPSVYTANGVFDGNWHMLTVEIETNGDFHTFVDGNYDPGSQSGGPYTDNEGNPAIYTPFNVTNTYYINNIYPPAGVSNPPPNGFVRWITPGLYVNGFTAFGGYNRNGTIANGLPEQMSDIGFWNRTLTTNELQWLMTNGLSGLTINTNIISINNFSADFGEVGQGSAARINWNVGGASSSPGGIIISGPGINIDVSAVAAGSTNITLPADQTYTLTLTAHNGIVADKTQSISVKTFPGVPSDWGLVQRFDGLFANTTAGVNGNGVVSLLGVFSGAIDRFNVVTVNGNEALSPKSGYVADAGSPVGWDTEGSLTYLNLNGSTIVPNQTNTLFFRFSLHDPGSLVSSLGLYSGLDLAVGVSDYGFATGPIGGTQPPGGGGTYGPGFHIVRYDPGYAATPFDLRINDYSGSSVTNSFSYTNVVDANGLGTDVNYYCWIDIQNYNTMEQISGGVTNTINEPVFSIWLQKQGDANRTLLVSGYHGDRDYSQSGINNDFPTPNLNKVFFSIATENIVNGDEGAFFETNNMLLIDDIYLSKSGVDSTIPRLFDITSVVHNANSVTINWNSLGSLFQTNTYSIQRTFSLTNPSWTTITNGLPSGGDVTSFTDSTVGNANTAFYRISWP